MRRTHGGIALLASFALAAAAAPGVLATEASGPALVYEPPTDRVLTPADITFERNKRTGAVALKDRRGGPLAVTSVEVFGPTGASIQRTGADFTSPALWQAQGFGDVCWSSAPEVDPYVLPMPDQAYGAPAGDWEYQNVIVTTADEPIVYNLPQPGQYVTGQGAAMESVIFCVRAIDTTQVRLRPLADEPTDSTSATDAPEATSSSSAASESASPESSASSTPTEDPEASESATSDPSESASATSESTGRPRPLSSVTSTPSVDEVEDFVAPLLNVTVKKKPVNDDDKEEHKVRICHATPAEANPYNDPEVDTHSTTLNGHKNHENDIIPPNEFEADETGRNWTSDGQAIYNNACEVPDDDQGWLTITNTVDVPDGVAVPVGSYSFTWSCSKEEKGGDDAFREDHKDQSGTLAVAPGKTERVDAEIKDGSTCSVSLDSRPKAPEGYYWEQASFDPEDVEVDKGFVSTITATNTLTPKERKGNGSLTIALDPLHNPDGSPTQDRFTFDYTCSFSKKTAQALGHDHRDDVKSGTRKLSPGMRTTIDGIPAGQACTVTERQPRSVSDHSWRIDYSPANGSVTIPNGGDASVTVTNHLTADNGSLTVTLANAADMGGAFTVFYHCYGFGGLAAGSAVLTAANPKETWTVPSESRCVVGEETPTPPDGSVYVTDIEPSAVWIAGSENETITITNTLEPSSASAQLDLVATLVGDLPTGYEPNFVITYECIANGDTTSGSSELSPGTPKAVDVKANSMCEVTNSVPTVMVPPGSAITFDTTPASVTIAGGTSAPLTIVNTVTSLPDPIVSVDDIGLTSLCKPAPDEGRLRLSGPASSVWELTADGDGLVDSGTFSTTAELIDVPWTSPDNTWVLTVTGADSSRADVTTEIGDNDLCSGPTPDPTDPQPIIPSVDPGAADSPSSAGETEEQAVENRVLDFCDSKDPADLPEGMAEAEVAMTVTNGVSTTEIREPWANLYCVAKANRSSADAIKAGAAGGSDASSSSDGSDSGDDVLAKTGGTALTTTVGGGVILLGLALLVAPARRRRG